MKKELYILGLCLLVIAGCSQQKEAGGPLPESKEAKQLMQGIWIDEESEELVFRVKGDSVFFPDTVSMPAYFRIYDDSLYISSSRYEIIKQSPNLFWFKNLNGDVLKLRKSTEATDEQFFGRQKTKILQATEATRKDTVVFLDGKKYHCYIDVNPTKYKVEHPSYNSSGVEVNNVYYDNIIHLSVYEGARKLYSKDVRKQAFEMVPKDFLEQAVLGDVEFHHADQQGFHFLATLCIPDGASCYRIEVIISHAGAMTMQLLEY